jgi:hypothetical protein
MHLPNFFIFIIFMPVTSALASMDPVIWRKLNYPLVEGIETTTTVISYQSPCNLFSEFMIDQKASHELREW